MASQQLLNIIIKATDEASAAAKKVDESLKNIGKSSSALSRIPGFDAMKTKFSSIASTLDGKFGGAITKVRQKFTNLKSTVTGVATNIKSRFGGAIDGVRNKLQSLSNGSKGLASGLGFLKGAVSMTAGMIGYDLLNSLVETTRASLNARSSIQAFSSRLKMSGAEVTEFQKNLDELQNTYKKIDMDVVGQQATDMAYRLGLPKTSLTELTETTAIFSDAMQRNGRSAEDSMLAMSDAMDGQFTRLKEIGIGQDDLMRNGWDGDINNKTGLLNAMNKALKEQHYDDLAKSVDTLDDAWQVLSITLSNFVEAILLPLTPAIVGIVNGFTNAINAIKPFIGMLQNAWGALPDWMQDSAWAIALGVGIAILAQYITVALLPAFAEATLAALEFAAAMLANPVTWVIMALVAIALAIYEVGKAFGWWTDVQSMLAAIWDGINRLWQAFINHPDVQAALKAISDALAWIWDGLQQAGQAVLDFFGINTSGNFDIVRALIEGIGKAWEIITLPIRTVITLVQMAATSFGNFYNGTLVPLGDFLQGIFGPVWEWLMDLIGQLAPYVTQVSDAFTAFQEGQLDLPGLIWSILTAVWNAYVTIFTNIISALSSFAMNLLGGALTAGSNLVSGVVTWISQLPGRVWNYMVSTLTRIIMAGVQWVTAARTKANQLVSGVISFLRSLPGRAYSALLGVVTQIASAGARWVSSAKQKAMDVVNGAVNTLSQLPGKIASALGGVVDAIVKPFKDAYDQAKSLWDQITNLGHAAGGDMPAAGGDVGIVTGSNTVSYIVEADNSPIVIEDNLNLTLDLKNVPSNISTDGLIEALRDKNVLSAIANNRDFQDIDARVKQRINLKYGRSRGL